MMTSLPSKGSAISLGAKDSGTTRRQDTYLKLVCNSGQTVPLILETGLLGASTVVKGVARRVPRPTGLGSFLFSGSRPRCVELRHSGEQSQRHAILEIVQPAPSKS